MSNVLSLDNPVFASYVFYAGVLAVKMALMGPLTGYFRITRKAFANPEDAAAFGSKDPKTNNDVERVRRAHQNDLENIPLFWMIGSLYTLSNPNVSTAKLLFKVYAMSRVGHTVMYLTGSRMRGLAYGVGLAIQFYMVGSFLYLMW